MKAYDKKLRGEFTLQILTSAGHCWNCYLWPFSAISESQDFHYGCFSETEKKRKGKNPLKCFMKGQRRMSKRKATSKECFKCSWKVIKVCFKTAIVLNCVCAAPRKNYLGGCAGGLQPKQHKFRSCRSRLMGWKMQISSRYLSRQLAILENTEGTNSNYCKDRKQSFPGHGREVITKRWTLKPTVFTRVVLSLAWSCTLQMVWICISQSVLGK